MTDDEDCTGLHCAHDCYLQSTGCGRGIEDHPVRLRVPEDCALHHIRHCALLRWRQSEDGIDFILDPKWTYVHLRNDLDAFRFKLRWL
jgi:hypothetical protein